MKSFSGPRTVVIGDIHGCLDELQALLGACAVDWSADRVISVGDLVAKGPDSRGVLRLVRERRIDAVLGNHDAKVLSYAPSPGDQGIRADRRGGGDRGGGEHAAIARSLDTDDWRQLAAMPLVLELPRLDTIVVHAGLVAGIPVAAQPRELVINMRSITPDGQPSKRVEDGVPWASVWPGPAHVVFGHDAVRGLQQHPFATGLDTGCVYGRSLTAFLLPERRLISVPARRTYAAAGSSRN